MSTVGVVGLVGLFYPSTEKYEKRGGSREVPHDSHDSHAAPGVGGVGQISGRSAEKTDRKSVV